MTDGVEIAAHIIEDGARLEREKSGKALTAEEARTIQAAAFLRKIAPWLVKEQP